MVEGIKQHCKQSLKFPVVNIKPHNNDFLVMYMLLLAFFISAMILFNNFVF